MNLVCWLIGHDWCLHWKRKSWGYNSWERYKKCMRCGDTTSTYNKKGVSK